MLVARERVPGEVPPGLRPRRARARAAARGDEDGGGGESNVAVHVETRLRTTLRGPGDRGDVPLAPRSPRWIFFLRFLGWA